MLKIYQSFNTYIDKGKQNLYHINDLNLYLGAHLTDFLSLWVTLNNFGQKRDLRIIAEWNHNS